MAEESANKPRAREVRKGRDDLFERTVLPYLNSAYNLARWLTRNEQDAEDIVQEAFLRALKSFDTFLPDRDARAWLLTIVRNCCRTSLKRNRGRETEQLDDTYPAAAEIWPDPETELIRNSNSQQVRAAMETLPVEYREILVLRELEELSYKEIAEIVDVPIGTVMSRLSRARTELYNQLAGVAGASRK